jgi:dienelactone hydrolase
MAAFENLPKEIRADAPLWGLVVDLPAERPVDVTVKLRDDLGQTWRSNATFRSSPEGTLDLAGAKPVEAAWKGSDAYGTYWSMGLVSPNERSPMPYFDAATASLDPLRLELEARVDGAPVARGEVERRFVFRCSKEEWRNDDLVANLFVPVHPTASQGVLVIGGSSGGFAWSSQVAALIAASGRAALAVAYFDWQGAYGLSTSIAEISLETFVRALDRLKGDPRVLDDDLAVVGYSKGAEATLLLAAEREDVRKVVAYAPSSHVWESVRADPFEPPRSSWTWGGEPLPFARFDADEEFYRTLDKTRLRPFHERALENEGAIRQARIPVERTDADILLVSGTADGLWPSTPMCETVTRELKDAGRESQVQHVAFEGAGHFFFVPGMPVNRMDGTPLVNAYADRKGWGATREHLGVS